MKKQPSFTLPLKNLKNKPKNVIFFYLQENVRVTFSVFVPHALHWVFNHFLSVTVFIYYLEGKNIFLRPKYALKNWFYKYLLCQDLKYFLPPILHLNLAIAKMHCHLLSIYIYFIYNFVYILMHKILKF